MQFENVCIEGLGYHLPNGNLARRFIFYVMK